MRQHQLTAARTVLAAALVLMSARGAFAQAPAAPATGSVRRLSIDDAVRLALEQNLSLQVERLTPQISDLSIAQAQSVWRPALSTTITGSGTDNPSNSFLSGGQTSVNDGRFSTGVGVSQLFRWGGNYSVQWDSSRSTTTNVFSNFDPTLRSNLALRYTQPLLRNFKLDNARQQLLVSRKNREISDVELRQIVVTTVRNVRNAYWDLSYATASLTVQRQSLELAQTSLRNTRSRVEIGTMAPIDIVEAEAEVALRDEAVILAEAAVSQAEDRLRALILDPATPDFWNVTLQLTDTAPFAVQPIDVDAAMRAALDKRTDVQQARKSLESNDVNIQYLRNQTLPDVNLEFNYGLSGLGGTQFIRGQGFPGPIVGRTARSFGTVLRDVFANDFPNWTLSVNIGYPIGISTAEASLARARLQYSQAQMQIRNLELQVATQVRDAGRQVNTNLKRVDSTRASRQLNERRLEAEEKKFSAGTSTSFFVFQAQRDLAQARNNDLKAILDYNKSLVDFEAVQEAALTGGSIVISGSSSSTAGVAAATSGTSAAATAGTTSATSAGGASGQRGQ